MNAGTEIRTRVTTQAVAAKYGLATDKRGWATCPLHPDHRPSLRVYEGDRGWHCFQCGAGGSAIDLVMAVQGLTFPQAVARINYDFSLGLTGSKPSYRAKRLAAEQAKARALQAKRDEYTRVDLQQQADAAFSWWQTLKGMLEDYRPRSPDEPFHPMWVYAQQHIQEAYNGAQDAEERVRSWSASRQARITSAP